jgi:hypothetical protein
MQEQGYKDFVFATDTVLLAPAKTPPEIVKWLEQETLKVLSTPEMKEKLFKAGFLVRPKGADAAWARVTKEIGFKACSTRPDSETVARFSVEQRATLRSAVEVNGLPTGSRRRRAAVMHDGVAVSRW